MKTHNGFPIQNFQTGTILYFEPKNIDGTLCKCEWLEIGATEDLIWRDSEDKVAYPKPKISLYHGWIIAS